MAALTFNGGGRLYNKLKKEKDPLYPIRCVVIFIITLTIILLIHSAGLNADEIIYCIDYSKSIQVYTPISYVYMLLYVSNFVSGLSLVFYVPCRFARGK